MNRSLLEMPDGRKAIRLQLEPGNLHRLQNGDPIMVHLNEFFPNGIPKNLVLFIDYTETPIAEAAAAMQQAEMAFDERTAVSKQKRPHCPECKSTIEQLGLYTSNAPVALVMCSSCGAVFGAVPAESLPKVEP